MKKFTLIITMFILFLRVIPISAGEVTLQWDAAVNASGYRIYYGADVNNMIYSINTGNMTTWKVSDLKCGVNYHFRVTAYNEKGESDPSNTISTTMPACPALPALPEGWAIDSLVIVPVQ